MAKNADSTYAIFGSFAPDVVHTSPIKAIRKPSAGAGCIDEVTTCAGSEFSSPRRYSLSSNFGDSAQHSARSSPSTCRGIIPLIEEGCGMVTNEDQKDDCFATSCSHSADVPPAIAHLYQSRPFRSASVLLVGRSTVHNAHAALLAGCVDQKGLYCFGDFGANINWGEDGKHLKRPHGCAFLSLSKELFRLEGEAAIQFAEQVWTAARHSLIGNAPVVHGSHLVFLLPADALDQGMDTGDIDNLLDKFVPGRYIDDVALVELKDLLAGGETVAPLAHFGRRNTRFWSTAECAGRASLAKSQGKLAVRSTFRGSG
jgi:hypothetical protein